MRVRLTLCPGSAWITHGQLSDPYRDSAVVTLAMLPEGAVITVGVDRHVVKGGVTTETEILSVLNI